MNSVFYVAGTAGLVAQKKLDGITHNLANVNTVGYRADGTSFSTYLTGKQAPDGSLGKDNIAYVTDGEKFIDNREGTLMHTGRDLDMALHGPGYFHVRLNDGSEAYTRAGNFQLDAGGNLMTMGGQAVLDDGGSPINVSVGRLVVDEDGSMHVNGTSSGRIGVVQLVNPRNIQKIGGALLTTSPGNVKSADKDVQVMQNFTESSNVNAIQEMVRMVSVQRNFQGTMKILQQYDRLATMLNEQVGRVQA